MTSRREEILELIRTHLEARGIDREVVEPQSDLFDDVGLDSLDTMDLTLALEEKFSLEIPDADLERLRTVQDAVDLIETKLAATV